MTELARHPAARVLHWPPAPAWPVHLAVDLEVITARAQAAPGGSWTAFTDRVQVPWSPPCDDAPYGRWDAGRYLAVQAGDWHAGSEDPPPALYEFLAAARADVLALAAEVRRLTAELAAARKGAA